MGVMGVMGAMTAVWGPFADYEFMRRALAGCVCLSVGASPLGVILLLRRMSLVGEDEWGGVAGRTPGGGLGGHGVPVDHAARRREFCELLSDLAGVGGAAGLAQRLER